MKTLLNFPNCPCLPLTRKSAPALVPVEDRNAAPAPLPILLDSTCVSVGGLSTPQKNVKGFNALNTGPDKGE